MSLEKLFQSVITSDIAPRKAVKKTISLIKRQEYHAEFLELLLFVLDAKKETSNLAVFFRFQSSSAPVLSDWLLFGLTFIDLFGKFELLQFGFSQLETAHFCFLLLTLGNSFFLIANRVLLVEFMQPSG